MSKTGGKKRKATDAHSSAARKKPRADKSKKSALSEVIDDDLLDDDEDESNSLIGDGAPNDEDEDFSDHETAAEKRVRLAKQYISKVQEQKELLVRRSPIDANVCSNLALVLPQGDVDDVDDAVAQQLQQDVMESHGKLQTLVADKASARAAQLSNTNRLSRSRSASWIRAPFAC